MSIATAEASAPRDIGPSRLPASQRLNSIDLLRGLVIVIMVLDHVRDLFFDPGGPNPTNMAETNPALFATRWVTHLCAPTFVLLAGVSVYLQEGRGKSKAHLSGFLVSRGLWLIFLEVTLVGVGFNFGPTIFLQVIWAIGAGFIALALLIWAPRTVVLAIGVAIVIGHQALAVLRPEHTGLINSVWMLLLERGRVGVLPGYVSYPALPWLGVLCLGYGIGPVFKMDAAVRRRWMYAAAMGGVVLFLVIRLANGYGDPHPWETQKDAVMTVVSFFNVTKYPPSLDYLLIMLSIAIVLLLLLEHLRGVVGDVLLDFGRTPLFTYLLHLYIAHLLALIVGVAQGLPASIFFNYHEDATRADAAGWGFDLPGIYLVWIVVLFLLYPAAHWFAGVKRRRRAWWLSYL
jgi:uncharacterized membrane protein